MKKFYASKTIYFGALFIANAFAMAFGFGDFVPGAELSEITSLAIGVVIWGLRLATDKGIE